MYRVLQRNLLVLCRGLRGDMQIKPFSGGKWALNPCDSWPKKADPEASTQWSKTVVSTVKAVLFLPARTCTPSYLYKNYGKSVCQPHLGCPLTAIVPRAKQKHKL